MIRPGDYSQGCLDAYAEIKELLLSKKQKITDAESHREIEDLLVTIDLCIRTYREGSTKVT